MNISFTSAVPNVVIGKYTWPDIGSTITIDTSTVSSVDRSSLEYAYKVGALTSDVPLLNGSIRAAEENADEDAPGEELRAIDNGGGGKVLTSQSSQILKNSGVVVGENRWKITTLMQKIRAAVTNAKNSNSVVNNPWFRPATWAPSTGYYVGHVVVGLDGSNTYICKSAGTSAASGGPTGNGYNLINDGGVTWEWYGLVRGEGTIGTASAWIANTAYTVGTTVLSSDGYNLFVCVGSGTSAAAPATGPNGYRTEIVPDGSAVWKWKGTSSTKPIMQPGAKATLLASIPNYKTLTPSMLSPIFYWTGGVFEFDTVNGNVPNVRGSNTGTLASPSVQNGTGGNSVTFWTDSSKIAFGGINSVYAQESCVVEVNGRLLDDSMFAATSTNNPGAWLLDLSFLGKNVSKKVRIYNKNAFHTFCSKNVYIEPDSSIWQEGRPNGWSLAAEGDSLTVGGNGTPYHGGLDVVTQVANLLGCDTYANMAQGGTGFLATRSGAATTYIQRLDRLVSLGADVYFVGGNHNDASFTSEQRITACLGYFQALRAAQPDAYVIVAGTNPLQSESSNTGAILTCEQDLYAAFLQWNDPNSMFIPIATSSEGPWITGTGSVISPANNGNKDKFFITADGHPLQRGVNYLAQRYAQAIGSALV